MEVRKLSISQDCEHEEHREWGDAVTQEEVDYACTYYAKHLTYLDSLDSGIPQDPLTQGEMERLANIMGRMARQGKTVSLPSMSVKPF